MIPNAAQYAAFSKIVEHESGWNVTATNSSSGAYGLVQALPGSKMASAGSDWKTNPKTQIKWGLDYMNVPLRQPGRRLELLAGERLVLSRPPQHPPLREGGGPRSPGRRLRHAPVRHVRSSDGSPRAPCSARGARSRAAVPLDGTLHQAAKAAE